MKLLAAFEGVVVQVVAPAGENVPSGQASQSLGPIDVLYFPAGHEIHGAGSAPPMIQSAENPEEVILVSASNSTSSTPVDDV